MTRPAADIIRSNVRVDLGLPFQEGPMLENPLACKAAREERCV
jgi:hypothetical protein